jgi:hypothetical protein
MISTPNWQWPGLMQAPGSWLLLEVLLVVAIVLAPRVVSAASSLRTRIPVALTYGLTVIAMLAAVVVLALILPAYQDATLTDFLGFQPGASTASTDCALEFLNGAQFTGTVFTQFGLLCLALALLNGMACGWLRGRGSAK